MINEYHINHSNFHPSQSYVSIKQSDSPAQQQFHMSHSVDTRMDPQPEGHESPTTERRRWMAEPPPQMTEATHEGVYHHATQPTAGPDDLTFGATTSSKGTWLVCRLPLAAFSPWTSDV